MLLLINLRIVPDDGLSAISTTKVKEALALHGIFYWSLVREFASTGLLVFSILLGIVVFTQLIRLLGDSVSGLLGGGRRFGDVGFQLAQLSAGAAFDQSVPVGVADAVRAATATARWWCGSLRVSD